MGDGVRLAIAIAFVMAAGIAFFFAFHPNGVGGTSVDNADSALQWLMQEFEVTAGDTSGEPAGNAGGSGGVSATSPSADQPGGTPESPAVAPQVKDIGPG
jgi:hypothetical protein